MHIYELKFSFFSRCSGSLAEYMEWMGMKVYEIGNEGGRGDVGRNLLSIEDEAKTFCLGIFAFGH